MSWWAGRYPASFSLSLSAHSLIPPSCIAVGFACPVCKWVALVLLCPEGKRLDAEELLPSLVCFMLYGVLAKQHSSLGATGQGGGGGGCHTWWCGH